MHFQAVDKGMLKIGAMDISWDKKLVFVSSYSDDDTGIYSYPIPDKLSNFQAERTPSPQATGRRKRSADEGGSAETDMNESSRMKKLKVSNHFV